jgi:hypothetical protein
MPKREFSDTERLDFIERSIRKSRSGVSFDLIPRVEDERGGFRFMKFHDIGLPEDTLRLAIDKAMESEK